MKTLIRTCLSTNCEVGVPEAFGGAGFCLEHYVKDATQRLDAAKDTFFAGLGVDREALDWLLAQVDFVVETIANDNLTLDHDQRSSLLQLLLGIANLNECIHHPGVAVRQGL
jgi:hypothetical protein